MGECDRLCQHSTANFPATSPWQSTAYPARTNQGLQLKDEHSKQQSQQPRTVGRRAFGNRIVLQQALHHAEPRQVAWERVRSRIKCKRRGGGRCCRALCISERQSRHVHAQSLYGDIADTEEVEAALETVDDDVDGLAEISSHERQGIDVLNIERVRADGQRIG